LTDTDKQNSTGKYTHTLNTVKEVKKKQTQNTAEQNYPGSVSLLRLT